jgi:hypothetical protein
LWHSVGGHIRVTVVLIVFGRIVDGSFRSNEDESDEQT